MMVRWFDLGLAGSVNSYMTVDSCLTVVTARCEVTNTTKKIRKTGSASAQNTTRAAEQDDLRGSCSCGAGETGRHGAPAAARADPHAQVCCLTERATTESVCSSVANFAGKPESAPPVRPNVGKPEICLMLIS